MNIINPDVEYVQESEDFIEHIAKCASVCYKSEKVNSKQLYNRLLTDNHISMFRHASAYYMVTPGNQTYDLLNDYIEKFFIFGENPFVAMFRDSSTGVIYMSTNLNYIYDNSTFSSVFKDYQVTRSHFEANCPTKDLLRVSLIVTTSIKISRELNRTSPNNIAEQSTRYVNFNKKGGVSVCSSFEPEYLTAADTSIIRNSIADSCKTYENLVESGVKPEDARRVLPIDTATRCVYTYNIKEWKHILDLRLYEKTGKAAPDAKIVAEKISEKLKENNYL